VGIEKKELLAILEKCHELELGNIKKCHEKEERLKSLGAKLMLSQIRIDSTKHEHLFQILIDMINEGSTEYPWDYRIDKFVGQRVVEWIFQEYIETEKEMVKDCREIIQRADEPGLKMVLQYMIEDKKMQEALLGDTVKQLFRLGPIELRVSMDKALEHTGRQQPDPAPRFSIGRLINRLRGRTLKTKI